MCQVSVGAKDNGWSNGATRADDQPLSIPDGTSIMAFVINQDKGEVYGIQDLQIKDGAISMSLPMDMLISVDFISYDKEKEDSNLEDVKAGDAVDKLTWTIDGVKDILFAASAPQRIESSKTEELGNVNLELAKEDKDAKALMFKHVFASKIKVNIKTNVGTIDNVEEVTLQDGYGDSGTFRQIKDGFTIKKTTNSLLVFNNEIGDIEITNEDGKGEANINTEKMVLFIPDSGVNNPQITIYGLTIGGKTADKLSTCLDHYFLPGRDYTVNLTIGKNSNDIFTITDNGLSVGDTGNGEDIEVE
jgi:hypothetical protein